MVGVGVGGDSRVVLGVVVTTRPGSPQDMIIDRTAIRESNSQTVCDLGISLIINLLHGWEFIP